MTMTTPAKISQGLQYVRKQCLKIIKRGGFVNRLCLHPATKKEIVKLHLCQKQRKFKRKGSRHQSINIFAIHEHYQYSNVISFKRISSFWNREVLSKSCLLWVGWTISACNTPDTRVTISKFNTFIRFRCQIELNITK